MLNIITNRSYCIHQTLDHYKQYKIKLHNIKLNADK